MQATGNDFLVMDDRWYHFSDDELSDLARTWCPRRFGVGADGILLFAEAEGDADFRMRYVNADGSPATMCGNGARCLARYARTAGVETSDVTFETAAGLYRAHVPDASDAPVRLFVPEPQDLSLDHALDGGVPAEIDAAHYVWTGTEHLVVYVGTVSAAEVDAWGRALRRDDALAPAGANVNFVQVEDGSLHVRTYEKGVEAETLSCGTGVLASAVVARETGRASDRVPVHTPGGTLTVGRDDGQLYLEGPAQVVFRGTLEVTFG